VGEGAGYVPDYNAPATGLGC